MRIKLIILLCLVFHRLAAPCPTKEDNRAWLAVHNSIMACERTKNRALEAIIWQETRGRWWLYNEKEQAAGILQIRPIMVEEANRAAGCEKYKLWDRWDTEKSIEMFWLVQEFHGTGCDVVQMAMLWNTGQKTGEINAYTKSVLKHIAKLDKGEKLK